MSTEETRADRRGFLGWAVMGGSLALGYGIGAFEFLSYLVPLGQKTRLRELYVGRVDDLKVGESRPLKAPSGETFVMARTEGGFRVLSDVCPHLGCRVHWQAAEGRFFCPCHAGVFDAEGRAVSGPPAEADQALARLEAIVRGQSVFVLVKES